MKEKEGREPSEFPPFLWVLYIVGDSIFLKETSAASSAIFRDTYSTTRHSIEETSGSVSRPSVTVHRGSQWVAWRENNTISARAVWWGPGRTRTIYDGGTTTPTAPALVSFGDYLVAVWGVGDTLYMSSSEYGVEWSEPVGHQFEGSTINSPVITVHQGRMFAGIVIGYSLFTILIKEDLTWGSNYRVLKLNEPVVPEVSLASNGTRVSLGFTTGDCMYVIHSPNGYSNWTEPVEISSGSSYPAPPALYYYNNYLYAVFPTGLQLVMRRSSDGTTWTIPTEVDSDAPGLLPAALVSSHYSVVPPTPKVRVLNSSNYPPSDTLNMVFISEGYLESEMEEFRKLVERASNAFRIINPYSRHLDKYNMYRIDIPSREKGVDASPKLAAAVQQGIWNGTSFVSPVPQFQPRYTDTALGSYYAGKWQGHPGSWRTGEEPGNSDDILTDQKAIFIFKTAIFNMVGELIPGFDRTRDVLYCIVNQIPEDGGTEKWSFNPVVSTNDFAEGLGNIHEMGHFLIQLADEDLDVCWGGVETDCGTSANKTINSDLSDPNHKWAHFFVKEGRPGDSIVANPVSRPPDWDHFWDPSEVNANSIFNVGLWASSGDTEWSYTNGAIVYAPVQQCLMNHSGGTTHFCPVCTEEVVKKLFECCGEPFSEMEYNRLYDHVYVELKYRSLDEPKYPKNGFISVNGSNVTENKYTCFNVGENELCSIDVTEYVSSGTNRLIFHQQPGFVRQIDLLSIQVVNSNGAPLHLFPITDLSSIGTPKYFAKYFWETGNGSLEFEFTARPH